MFSWLVSMHELSWVECIGLTWTSESYWCCSIRSGTSSRCAALQCLYTCQLKHSPPPKYSKKKKDTKNKQENTHGTYFVCFTLIVFRLFCVDILQHIESVCLFVFFQWIQGKLCLVFRLFYHRIKENQTFEMYQLRQSWRQENAGRLHFSLRI